MKFSKKIVLVSVVVVLGVCAYFVLQENDVKSLTNQQVSKTEQETFNVHLEEKNEVYSYVVDVPQIALHYQNAVDVNDQIKSKYDANIQSFKFGLDKGSFPDGEPLNRYKVGFTTYTNEKYISIVTEESYQFARTSEMPDFFHTFIYDKSSGKLVTLSDVFNTTNSFNKKVSEILFSKLVTIIPQQKQVELTELQKQDLKEYLSHGVDSYSDFSFDENHIQFYFSGFHLQAPNLPKGFLETSKEVVTIDLDALKEFKK